ncbi:MAG: hypothetical protein J1E39_09410 [Eubacterium sp.]|nr:hypothetical protein [Eubacterium sp.]
MSKALVAIGLLAVASAGFILGKKYIEKNPGAIAAVKENTQAKLQSASVYCAGAIKTGSEKVLDSVNNIVTASKEKGTKLVNKAKTTTTGFKNELDNLRDMVVSVSKGASVDISEEEMDPLAFEEEMGEAVEAEDAIEQTQAL